MDLGGTMVLHINKKIMVVALVLAVLITVFGNPQIKAKASISASKNIVKEAQNTEIVDSTVELIRSIDQESAVDPEPAMEQAMAEPEDIAKSPDIHFSLKATGYNSLASQTDSTPFITATGARTKFGVIAVSRDLLSEDIPYGSLVRIKDLGNYYNGRGAGKFQSVLDKQELFIVEDTMHKRKKQQIDVWFPRKTDALNWGVRQVEIEVVRYGRSGPILSAAEARNSTVNVD